MNAIPLRRAWAGALSRGPGYEPHPPGRFFDGRSVNGYFLDFGLKTRAERSRSPQTLVPAALAQIALGWWERMLEGETAAEAEFERACGLLERRAVVRGGELRWLYRVEVPKFGLAAGWSSALAQGQIASVFVRAYVSSGDRRYAALARRAVAPLLSTRTTDLVTITREGPVLEEAPGGSQILNGWIYGLWGLWDVAVGLDDEPARDAFWSGSSCLRLRLPAYDTGWWSRYSLLEGRFDDLAKPFYHRLHSDQLDVQFRLTGSREFRQTASRWRSYDEPLRRTSALGQKACFAVARRMA